MRKVYAIEALMWMGSDKAVDELGKQLEKASGTDLVWKGIVSALRMKGNRKSISYLSKELRALAEIDRALPSFDFPLKMITGCKTDK